MASNLTTLSFLSFFFFLMLSPTPLSASASRGCNKDDQKALLAIKAAFNNAEYFRSWDTSDSCCTWLGIDCEPKRGRVSGLTIFQENLAGTIPPAIAHIRYLQTLQLYDLPNLVGSIPPSFAKLNHISLLRVANTNISGTIPPFLGLLTNLVLLDLSSNRLSGSIPATLSNPPNLHYLHLDHNQLTGPIPDSFGSFHSVPNLELNLSHNALSGPLPASFGNPDWSIIDMSMNQFTGDASSLLVSSKPAIVIDLSRNMLSFDLSPVSFLENLTALDLSHNKIYGRIPAQVNQLTDLVVQFNVSYNQLCGKIPVGPVTSQFDRYSYFHNKCLCGAPLPACK